MGSIHSAIAMPSTLETCLPPTPEQRLIIPGRHDWSQFKVLESLIAAEYPGVRLSYLDGCVELMTLSPEHELLKCLIEALLVSFFVETGIDAIPLGSSTLQSAAQGSSIEPDLSYCFQAEGTAPDLAIEIVLSSGGIEKLPKYQRFRVPEVWFWQNDSLRLYRLRGESYEPIDQSECLPGLSIDSLVGCVQTRNLLTAVRLFRQGLTPK
jgi:Uma2 family endonuclease